MSSNQEKEFSTEFYAENATTGELELYEGPIIKAFSIYEAIGFCQAKLPYLKVIGELNHQVSINGIVNIDIDILNNMN